MKRTILINARKSAGITQKELATVAGCSMKHIQQIEYGNANPTIALWAKIALELERYDENFDIMCAMQWEVDSETE